MHLIWPWHDRKHRFSWLKASTLALMFVPAIWIVYQVGTEQFGPVPLGGMTYWSGLWATALLLLALAITPAATDGGVARPHVCRRMRPLAWIHEEIMRLPMGYRTLIGGLGSTLSAGQRQRVLLARALYRRPRILFVDEGTANLDVELEKRINETLLTLPITRIHVAHRPQTIALADRVVRLGCSPDTPPGMRLLAAE
jgi:hypothetical protein